MPPGRALAPPHPPPPLTPASRAVSQTVPSPAGCPSWSPAVGAGAAVWTPHRTWGTERSCPVGTACAVGPPGGGGPGEEDIPRALPPLSASPKPRCPLRNAEGRTCAVPRHRQLRPRICLPLIQPTPTLGTPVFPSNHSGRRRRQQGPPGPRAGPRQGPHPHTALQVPGSRQSHPRAPARAPLQSEQPGKHCGPSGAERREADGAQARALCRAGPRGQPGPACGRLSELKWPLTELIRLRQRQLSTEPENLPESAA